MAARPPTRIIVHLITDTGNWVLGTGYWFSENCIVVKLNISACSLIGRIDHASIKGSRINVQRNGALVRFPRIHHPVHRLLRIDRARVRQGQLHRVRCRETALARLDILELQVEIFDKKFSDRRGHPAILDRKSVV